jgi:ribose transport system permease protein
MKKDTRELIPNPIENEEVVIGVGNRAKSFLGRFNARDVALIAVLIGMSVYFTVQSQYFFQTDNILNIARSAAVNGIVAAGETMVLISGGLDLSISSVMAAAGMVTAASIHLGLSPYLAIVVGLAFGAIVGFINGIIITKMRINPLITTLATMAIIRGYCYVVNNGLSFPIGNKTFRSLGLGKIFDIPKPAILLIIVFVIVYLILRYTQFGRYVYAIGGNANSCRLCGLNVDRWRLVTYILCGVCAAFGGIVLTAIAGTAIPNSASGYELVVISAVILGGTSLAGGEGSVLGTLLAMIVISTVANGMTILEYPVYWQQIIQGFILLIAVLIDAVQTGGWK